MALNGKQILGRKEAALRVQRLEQAELGLLDLISEDDARELLVHRVLPLYTKDWPGDVRKKVKQRINVALKNGELKLEEGGFVLGLFITWARSKSDWQFTLEDLPGLNIAQGDVTLPQPIVAGRAYVLPATIAECHEHLQAAHARIWELEDRLHQLDLKAKD